MIGTSSAVGAILLLLTAAHAQGGRDSATTESKDRGYISYSQAETRNSADKVGRCGR